MDKFDEIKSDYETQRYHGDDAEYIAWFSHAEWLIAEVERQREKIHSLNCAVEQERQLGAFAYKEIERLRKDRDEWRVAARLWREDYYAKDEEWAKEAGEVERLRKIEDAAHSKLNGRPLNVGAFLHNVGAFLRILNANPRPKSR